MQKAVAATAASSNSLYFAPESASRNPTPARAQSTGALAWSQSPREHQNLNPESATEAWNISSPQDLSSALSASIHRPLSINRPSAMHARTNLNDVSKNETSGHPSERLTNSAQRWRLNGSGQLVDPGATLEWDLAQEIARLKLSSVGDITDDIEGRLGTPPQSKLGSANVAPYDASPLETASDASLDSSPNTSDHQISPSHSRVSSTDTLESHESVMSSASHTMRAPPQLKIATGNDGKERPHSFSGGLSAADLRRLKQAGEEPWSSATYRDRIGEKPFSPDQPTYPSLTNPSFGRGQQFDIRAAQGNGDFQGDYSAQRNYFPQPSAPAPSAPQPFLQGRTTNGVPATYRQSQRGYPAQPVVPSPTALAYSGHAPHLSLGNNQQLYELVHPTADSLHPAITRVQQQHNVFRATHQHSSSDPSALRDAATFLSNQALFAQAAQSMYPPIHPSLYNQFYGTPETYSTDLALAAMANRLQTQFTSPYAGLPAQGLGVDHAANPVPTSPQQNGGGPSANNRKLGLYKTELCRSWEEKGSCRYGAKCQFAHGEDELRNVARHPKYKTEICRTFWVSGACPYGKRCCFIHTELPVSGIAPGADGAPPPSATVGSRERSNSDPNECSISLLQRIQRKGDATPADASPSVHSFNSRPPTGSLRVDTTALNNITKQNKSAYPSFASNALMLSSSEQTPMKSPVVPLTAGPDLGRHNNSRLDIVGYNQQRLNKATVTTPNARHSFNGTDVDLDFSSPSTPSAANPSFALAQTDRVSNNTVVPRAHVRSGSAGNWGSVSRSSNLAGIPSYPQTSGAGGEVMSNSPWASGDLMVGGRMESWM